MLELDAVGVSFLGRNGQIEPLNRSQRDPSRRTGAAPWAPVGASGFLAGAGPEAQEGVAPAGLRRFGFLRCRGSDGRHQADCHNQAKHQGR